MTSKAEQSAEPFLSDSARESIDLEIQPNELEHGHHQRLSRVKLRGYLHTFGTIVLSVGWIVAFVLFFSPRAAEDATGLSTPLPKHLFNTVKRTFGLDERYVGPSEEANDNWHSLIAGHDVLYVSDEDKAKYGLPQGMLSPFFHPNRPDPAPQNFYVLSVMHSMHCLNHVRAHYWQIKTGSPSYPNYTDAKWDVHIDHCFEYLRQSVLCGHSIFEIEGYTPLFVPGEGVATTVSGWGLEHDCIDYDAIYKYQVEQEAAYNRTWQGKS